MEAEEILTTGDTWKNDTPGNGDSDNNSFYTTDYTTMQQNFDPVKNCDNCSSYLENDLGNTKVIFDESESNKECNDVQLYNALAFIYGLSWEEFRHWPNKSSLCVLNLSSVTFCKTCTILLSENYKTLKAFENLSHSSSIVYQMKEFRNTKILLLEPKLEEEIDEVEEQNSRVESDEELNNNFNQPIQKQKTVEMKSAPENESPQEEMAQMNSEKNKIKTRRIGLRQAPKRKNMNWESTVNSRRVKQRKLLPKKTKSCNRRKKESDQPKNEPSQLTFEEKALLALQNSKDKTKLTKIVVSGRYICPICGEDFESYEKLKKEHWEQEHVNVTVCKLCGKCLKTARYLKSHMILVHERKGQDNNSEDHNDVDKRDSITNEDGMSKHRTPEAHQCEECGKQYASKYTLRLHMLVHTDSPLKCDYCEKTFTYADSLKNHVMREHERPEREMCCDICPMKFYTACDLRKHKKCHNALRRFVCEECGKSFKQIQHLSAHLQCHKDIKVSEEKGENAFICDECGRSFKHSLGLYKHKKNYHRGIHDPKRKVYECSFCGRILSNINILTSHENRHKTHNKSGDIEIRVNPPEDTSKS